MNRQITTLAVASIVLIAALIVGTTYWQTWASGGLAARQDNEIQRVAQFTIDRGRIYAANGKTLLAGNKKVKSKDGRTLYFRTYPSHGLASQVIGYSTQSRSRTGLERTENSYLTGSNADLGTILDTVGDRLKGTTIKGNDIVTTIRPGAQWLAQSLLRSQTILARAPFLLPQILPRLGQKPQDVRRDQTFLSQLLRRQVSRQPVQIYRQAQPFDE